MAALQQPLVVALEMGYGHLRPAHALAQALGARIYEADQPPLADREEQRLWAWMRTGYESLTRISQLPGLGAPLRRVVENMTAIPPLHPLRDLSAPTLPVRAVEQLAARGLGRGLCERLLASGEPLLSTFFVPALVAARRGLRGVHCVVTDSDINRIWAPLAPQSGGIRYFVPTLRTQRRLRAYGVPAEQIELTGFPLPHELLGGPDLTMARRNLAARLARLDISGHFRSQTRGELHHFLGEHPAPSDTVPLITYAVGGAGAQAELAEQFLPSLAPQLREGRLRLALVAGVRREVAARFDEYVRASRLESLLGDRIEIVCEDGITRYFERFNRLLERTDILWTKPSEITFYAALGIPLVFSWPVGVHERYNRRWAVESGAGLKQREPRFAGDWIAEWLADGTLAQAAWSGFMRLPKFGLYQILEAFGAPAPKVLDRHLELRGR
jgi:hypothetical protein